jgi:hypothetical protein
MKKSLTIIFILLTIGGVFSQNQENIKALADSAVKMFTWDIQKADKGSLMFLDVPYTRENHDSAEYLTITVAKDKSKLRPDFISIIIPNNIVKSNGIFIKFANSVKTKDGERKMEMEKGSPVRINFEKCDDDCTARIIEGYAFHDKTNEKEDVFQKFLDFDHVLFLFIYPDGSHKSVAVPLFSFKQQYKTL